MIPIVDIAESRAAGPAGAPALAEEIGRICEQIGFLVITGHGVDPALIEATYRTALEFFHLPLEEKLRSRSPDGIYRGYTPSATTALAASSDVVTPPDLCELFTVNRFDDPAAARRAGLREGRESFFAPNIWPAEPSGFRPVLERYYAAMEELSLHLMGLFAVSLGLDSHWFDGYFADHITNLTVNYYPAQPVAPVAGQLRRGAHTDWGSLTILYQDDAPGGLQVQTKSGEWLDVPPVPGSYVINLGDLMAFWTNNRWVSNVHRVVNPSRADAGKERVSIPFFHQPSYDAVITTIPSCRDPITDSTNADSTGDSTTSGVWILNKLRKTVY